MPGFGFWISVVRLCGGFDPAARVFKNGKASSLFPCNRGDDGNRMGAAECGDGVQAGQGSSWLGWDEGRGRIFREFACAGGLGVVLKAA